MKALKENEFIKYFLANKKKFLLIVFSSFLYAFATTSLLTKAATIPTGLSSISMTISFIVPILKPYLNFIYLAINIPLFIFFWKKIKKSYIYLTMTFLITNATFGFLIGFRFNGTSLDSLISQYVLVFCPPTDELESAYARAHGLNNIVSVQVNDYYKWLEANMGSSINKHYVAVSNARTLGVQKGWPIFVYVLTAVLIAGYSAGIAWKCGGSVGGTDIIAYYYSTKKKKSVGSLLTIIGTIIVSTMLLVVWALSSFVPSISKNINGFDAFIGLQALSSAIFIFLFGKIINMVYPKYEKVLLKFDTTHCTEVKQFLEQTNFNHPYKIHTSKSGYTSKEVYTFETVVLLLESESLIKSIKQIDPTIWVSKIKVNNIYGKFDYSKVE